MGYQFPESLFVDGRVGFGGWFRELVFRVRICVAVWLGLRWKLSFILRFLGRLGSAIHLVGL